MKKALIFGGGNIGRGFIAQLLFQSGYEIVFLDVNNVLIERFNKDRTYPIHLVSNESTNTIIVQNVRAVYSNDMPAAAGEFIDADIISTAVGVNNLEKIAPVMALGLQYRWNYKNLKPLNILVCENMIGADEYFRSSISTHLKNEEQKYLKEKVGFVETSIGRMVPSATNAESDNPLEISVEEYDELPVDRDGFIGEIPEIKNMIPFSPFDFYIKRKIYIHNMGHALVAYLGNLKDYTYIYQAVNDIFIKSVLHDAYKDINNAMSKEYNMPIEQLEVYTADLIRRFGNRALKDTVERVAKDPKRKLSANDRFVGTLKLCNKHNICSEAILLGIAAGFHYRNENDDTSMEIQHFIQDNGIKQAVINFTGLHEEEQYIEGILTYYEELKNEKFLEGYYEKGYSCRR
ncbi:MAG: mannitol-1-phosphate 5-dehydrogenase [Caldicoprobacterales bacterium]|jgi:mannitol-1-phosphate 5-dehydrogenase